MDTHQAHDRGTAGTPAATPFTLLRDPWGPHRLRCHRRRVLGGRVGQSDRLRIGAVEVPPGHRSSPMPPFAPSACGGAVGWSESNNCDSQAPPKIAKFFQKGWRRSESQADRIWRTPITVSKLRTAAHTKRPIQNGCRTSRDADARTSRQLLARRQSEAGGLRYSGVRARPDCLRSNNRHRPKSDRAQLRGWS